MGYGGFKQKLFPAQVLRSLCYKSSFYISRPAIPASGGLDSSTRTLIAYGSVFANQLLPTELRASRLRAPCAGKIRSRPEAGDPSRARRLPGPCLRVGHVWDKR